MAAIGCAREIPLNEVPGSLIEKGEPRAGAGLSSSLVVNDAGMPSVAYFHSDLGVLRVAKWDGAGWKKMSPAEADDKTETGRQLDFVYENERYYLAYQVQRFDDAAHESLVDKNVALLSSGDGETWTQVSVDENSARLGDFIALGLEGGKPVIAYYDDTNSDLMVAKRKTSGEFESSTIDAEGDVGKYVSMDVDASGTVHLAYYDASKGALKYAVETENGFDLEFVTGAAEAATAATTSADFGTWTRILAQPEGAAGPNTVAPKILYYDEAGRSLRIAERENGSWTVSTVDDGPFAGTDSDMVWQADGGLVVSYFDGYNLDLKLARRANGRWSKQTIASKGATGMYTSLVSLPGEKLGLTAYDLTQGALRYFILPVRQ